MNKRVLRFYNDSFSFFSVRFFDTYKSETIINLLTLSFPRNALR